MRKERWLLTEVPLDVKRREYLYYLLALNEYLLEYDLWNQEKWAGHRYIISIGDFGVCIYQPPTDVVDFQKRWGKYEVLTFNDMVRRLEIQLKIGNNEPEQLLDNTRCST